MRFSAKLQLLTCLVVYASSAHAIMVKFGTKDGPIVPPTPEPTLAPQPFRKPAPVWEERSNDTPDPNAQWRPPFFVPHPRYTNVIYDSPPPPQQLNNAQRFVNAYIPIKPLQYLQRGQVQRQNPPAILGSQSLPGIGLRYFFPAYAPQQKLGRQEDAKFNQLEGAHEPGALGMDSAHDFQWKYEKEATRRHIRTSQESTVKAPAYQWPAYVPPRHH